jgi:hypothetical protein
MAYVRKWVIRGVDRKGRLRPPNMGDMSASHYDRDKLIFSQNDNPWEERLFDGEEQAFEVLNERADTDRYFWFSHLEPLAPVLVYVREDKNS